MSSASPDSGALDAATLSQLREVITRAVAEDVGSGDITTESTVPADSVSTATFLAKDDGVLSGLAAAEEIFRAVDDKLKVSWSARDGDAVSKGTRFGSVVGSTRSLLVAERLVLNLMQRMSGVATATALFVRTMNAPHTRLLDTRKTVPGLRLLDKLAVRHGGGVNHRVGLYDMVLIKDNHIEAAGGIPNAVKAARAYLEQKGSAAKGIQVEVEARTLDEVRDVLACGGQVQRVLLDNMVRSNEDGQTDTSMLEQALQIIRQHQTSSSDADAAAPRLLTEASGNVNLRTIAAIGKTGVDFVSVGALTHSVTALDISMKIKLGQQQSQ